MASDEDLKLSDTLRYYMRDTFAAKRLLYKRLRCLANYEAANRNLEKARSKNKDILAVRYLLFYIFDFFQAGFAGPDITDLLLIVIPYKNLLPISYFKNYLVAFAELGFNKLQHILWRNMDSQFLY